METPEKVIQWHRLSARVFVEGSERRLMHEKAADTIERLQGLSTDLELLAKKRATLLEQAKQERDAALAGAEMRPIKVCD